MERERPATDSQAPMAIIGIRNQMQELLLLRPNITKSKEDSSKTKCWKKETLKKTRISPSTSSAM